MLHLLHHRLVRAVRVGLMIDGLAAAVCIQPFEFETVRRSRVREIQFRNRDPFDSGLDLGTFVSLLGEFPRLALLPIAQRKFEPAGKRSRS